MNTHEEEPIERKKPVDWKIWVILALLAALIGGILLWPKKPDTANVKIARDSISLYKGLAEAAIERGDVIVKQMANVKAKDSVAQEAFKREIRGLKKKAQEKRVVIQHVIDTIPAVAEFIALQDSIILADSIRILQLTMEKQVMEKGFNFLLAEKQNECDALRGMNSNLDYINEQQRKDLRKARRGGKVAKILIPVVGVGALLLGASL